MNTASLRILSSVLCRKIIQVGSTQPDENLSFSAQLLGLVALLLAVGVVVPLGELVAPVLQRLPVIDWLIK